MSIHEIKMSIHASLNQESNFNEKSGILYLGNKRYQPVYKSISKQTKKLKKIILLTHEDDTTVPVLEIEKQYMDCILSWYERCNLILDIEFTYIDVPDSISEENLESVLYKPMNYAYKDEFVNSYIPLMFKTIIANNTLEQFEEKFNIQNKIQEQCTKTKQVVNLGIITPTNLQSELYNDICISSNKSAIDDGYEEYNNVTTNHCSTFFAYNSEIVEETFDSKNQNSGNSIILVLLNVKQLQTIVVENGNEDENYTIQNYPEFGFTRLFGLLTDNPQIVEFVRHEFNQMQFNDIDEVNKRLSVTSQYIDFSNKHTKASLDTLNEEKQVKTYILNSYTISDDINHKMKASVLYDIIINSMCVFINPSKLNGFKNRLSKYLKDIQLSKKRYNDGYYYYGIQLKQDIDEYLTNTEILMYMHNRNKDI